MTFSLRQLEYFVAAAEAGQISAAARALMVSQSSVTTAVQDIEKQLQQALFTRASRGVVLTEAGKAFLPRARQILQLVLEASTSGVQDNSLQARVRVGVTYTVMGYFLPVHIQRLTALYPRLVIEWVEMDRDTAEGGVCNGKLDLAVLLTSNLRSRQLSSETLVHSPRRLWVAPHHPLTELAVVRLRDVAEHPYTLLTVDEADTTTRSYWGDLSPQVFLETTSIEAVRSVVANGNGVTILSDMVYRPWSLEGKRIQTIVLADPVPDMRIGLAWNRDSERLPAVAALQEYFHRQFNSPGLPA